MPLLAFRTGGQSEKSRKVSQGKKNCGDQENILGITLGNFNLRGDIGREKTKQENNNEEFGTKAVERKHRKIQPEAEFCTD